MKSEVGDGKAKGLAQALTKPQARALKLMSAEWQAGPSMPDAVLKHLSALRDAGLTEREFMDAGPPVHSIGSDIYKVQLSACWHFRLNPLGLAVVKHLDTSHAD